MMKSLARATALVAVSVLGVSGLSLAPANATAANKTMIVQESNILSGLNTAVNGKNLLTNSNVVSPTGAGFTYYNNKAQLIRNTNFGTFKITRNNCATAVTTDEFGCFSVTYTVKKGLKYSDGTLITAQDLLLSHAISSSDYSIKAGLGDPDSEAGSKFDSAGYGGAYDDHTRAESFDISDDNFSLTVKYDAFQPDWQIFGPGPGAVHALVALAKGKRTLQTARTNATYKSLFEDAYYDSMLTLPSQDDEDYEDVLDARTTARALMSKMATKWSTVWNITTVNSSTNPLLLVSNGTFMLNECRPTDCTLVLNPRANEGGAPKRTGNVEKIIFKMASSISNFSDTSVAQALANGEIDLYSGGSSAAFWSGVSDASKLTRFRGNVLTYEHFDIRTGDSQFPISDVINGESCDAPYDGPFKGNTQQAKDLRKAFLLLVPRPKLANTYVAKVFDPSATDSPVLNSLFSLTTEGDYSKVVAGSSLYVNDFLKDEATRVNMAKALVAKYSSTPIDVTVLTSTRGSRVDSITQMKILGTQAGFNITHYTNATLWSHLLDCNNFDAAQFAWVKTGLSQTGTNPQYESDGGNNSAGWNDPTLDNLLGEFEKIQTATSLITTKINAEKRLWSNYYTLPIYQWPGASAWDKDLKNILPSPLAPNVTWNYWSITY
jgi:peptide/nickel transport system substrate-binding protein